MAIHVPFLPDGQRVVGVWELLKLRWGKKATGWDLERKSI